MAGRTSHDPEHPNPLYPQAPIRSADVIDFLKHLNDRKGKGESGEVIPPTPARHEPSLTRSEARPQNVAICCIVLTTVLGSAYALYALRVVSLSKDSATIVGAPHISSPAAFTVTSEDESEQAFEDGTRARFSAGAAVEIDFTPNERVVRLLSGTVTFDVAKDPLRPFHVLANGVKATAVGTRFKVALKPTVRVDVYEGIVGVSEDAALPGAIVMKLYAGEHYVQPVPPRSAG